ncbi:MAG TPA: STAS domain-containing protein [Pseudonocardiaceae bacterium]
MPDLLSVTIAEADGAVSIAAHGEVDLFTVRTLEGAIAEVLTEDESATVVLDLTGVTFLASVGLNVMVVAHRECAKRGRALVVRASGAVRRAMRSAGSDTIVTVEDATDGTARAPEA